MHMNCRNWAEIVKLGVDPIFIVLTYLNVIAVTNVMGGVAKKALWTVHIGKKKLPTGNYCHIEIVNAPMNSYVRFHFHICLISINLEVGVINYTIRMVKQNTIFQSN